MKRLNVLFWQTIGKKFKPFTIPLKVEINKSREVEYTYISFISKNQIPFVMIIREYIYNGQTNYADCIKSIFY